ncbi:MAG: type II secretion system F family protein [Cellvibrionaceae bacterium]
MWQSIKDFFLSVWIFLLDLSAPVFMYGSALGFGVSVAVVYFTFKLLEQLVPEEDREYKDPLPPLLKIIWPMVRVIAYHLCTNLPIDYLNRLEKRLQQTGVAYILTAEEFFALRVISAVLFPVLAVFCMIMLHKGNFFVFMGAILLGFFYPVIWLQENKKKREKEVIRALPMYLEFISMSVEAGLNLNSAINQAVDKGPKGALRHEFQTVTRDIRAGASRADALQRLADRLDIQEVNTFVRAVIQAEKLGSSMRKLLKVQSEQRRNERFMRAEKMAMEAPVKLIFPLMAFIFPVTFMILAFPIIVKFMDQGFL